MYSSLIIGGTIKAATSSLFGYLSDHPEVCGSSVKETFFFTNHYTGNYQQDQECYLRYFSPGPGQKILLEASPNYLAFPENIAPRISSMLPEARILFVLRNPADRFYSHYQFARSKFEIAENISLQEYYRLCLEYSKGNLDPDRSSMPERSLRALEVGSYAKFLRNYYAAFSAEQIRVCFLDDLRRDPVGFMRDICDFAGLQPGFYDDYAFNRVNVTFSSKHRLAHIAAMLLNRALEPVLRQRPGIKRRIVRVYKLFNQKREGYQTMPDEMRRKLDQYYSGSNRDLAELLKGQRLPEWVTRCNEN